MGLVAGLIAAPCTGPVLGAVLTYVSTRQSIALGGSLLFVYALGMGLPFFIIGTFAVSLPKSGAWMDTVKSVFGVTMLVVALYFLGQVWSAIAVDVQTNLRFRLAMIGVAALGIAIGAIHLSFHGPWSARVRKGVGLLLAVGAAHFEVLSLTTAKLEYPTYTPDQWTSIGGGILERARSAHKPVVIDLGANWCPACKELELKTYPDRKVVAELQRFVFLKIDDKRAKLVEQFGGPGLPYVVFYDSRGNMLRDRSLSGYVPPDEFLQILKQVN
jgi:thiol:disulfide interchange protein DsbD